MAEIYTAYTNTLAEGAVAGFVNNAYITLKDWITTEVIPVANVAMGDKFKIATAHTWAAGKGVVPVYLFPKTAKQVGEMAGDQGAKIPVYKPTIKIKGDNPAAMELVDNFLNKEVIIFMVKPNGKVIQLGSGTFPAVVDAGNENVDVLGSGSAGTEITFETFWRGFFTPGVAGLTIYP